MNPFLGFQLPRCKLPEWMHSYDSYSGNELVLIGTQMQKWLGCARSPIFSEELLERIPTADCVISGLGHDTNHLKGGKVFFKNGRL